MIPQNLTPILTSKLSKNWTKLKKIKPLDKKKNSTQIKMTPNTNSNTAKLTLMTNSTNSIQKKLTN